MQVQSLSRREAVARMQAAEARLLGENQPQQAAQLVASRKVLDSARGDTLWDTYSRAADRGKRCERIQQALLPPVYRGSRDHPSRTPGLIMAGAATVATGAVWYLRTGQPLYFLAASMLVGLAAFPLVDATAASIEDSRQVDTRRVGMAGLLTASLAGAASGGWAAPVAA
ncbi:MAG: hypothetical protein KC910_22810, partial [Candidatus Eremiobacteraeota bacterium]|nr:hypothetical protein [Candidatus Eremiobacteraeota bacterium]